MSLDSGLRDHIIVFLKAGSETPPQRNHLPNNCRMFHVDSQLINHSACSTHKQVQQQLDSSGIKCCKRSAIFGRLGIEVKAVVISKRPGSAHRILIVGSGPFQPSDSLHLPNISRRKETAFNLFRGTT
jgi:hypothetical protein